MHNHRNYYWSIVGTALLDPSAPAMGSDSEPVELDLGAAPHNPQQPCVVVDAQESIHFVYGIGDLAPYRRLDDGKSFGKPVDLPSAHDMSLGMRRRLRIAVSDTSKCVSVIGGKQSKGRNGNPLALRSEVGGRTWTGSVQVNTRRKEVHGLIIGCR